MDFDAHVQKNLEMGLPVPLYAYSDSGKSLDGFIGDIFDQASDQEGEIAFSKTKRTKTSKQSAQDQKVIRRERNKEHAKKSRVRKKFLVETLQQNVKSIQDENQMLKLEISRNLPEVAETLFQDEPSVPLVTPNTESTTKILDHSDLTLVQSLQPTRQNFVISDPSLPDNPIVFASQGFLDLTGYSMSQVLGRNCRFLQGPKTDQAAISRIREAVRNGIDSTTLLLNYKADGSPFWNQCFVAALRDGEEKVVNFLGVQCPISDEAAEAYLSREKEMKD